MRVLVTGVALAAAIGLAGCATRICGTGPICMVKTGSDLSPAMVVACQGARKQLLARARQGEARAQFFVSSCYLGGFGKPDEVASVKWLQAALDRDLMVAKANYAYRLAHGTAGFARDPDAARVWTDKALEQWRQDGGDTDRPFNKERSYFDKALPLWQNGDSDFTDLDRGFLGNTVALRGRMGLIDNRKDEAFADLCLAFRLNPINIDLPQNLSLIHKKTSDCPAG